jgi:hypothetical protein
VRIGSISDVIISYKLVLVQLATEDEVHSYLHGIIFMELLL